MHFAIVYISKIVYFILGTDGYKIITIIVIKEAYSRAFAKLFH